MMLLKLFSTDFSKAGTEKWLQDNNHMFSIREEALVKALRDTCSPATGITPWERLQFLETCVQTPVIKQLRSLAESHEPPFNYIGVGVHVGILDPQPKEGTANVCKNNPNIDIDFFKKKIHLTNPQNGVTITVEATGYYICTGYNKYPDIQLNLKDAEKLFGDQNRQAYDTTKVIAVVIGG